MPRGKGETGWQDLSFEYKDMSIVTVRRVQIGGKELYLL
jgi:hypothetical protein